ncbi:actin-associated protein FAM107A [Coregonus clupeaformis]|uniref:actin-associated protein FAM107A n=1 Tax=Coregonus clupeaformis TaxID=59861 RepID=UPI001BE0F13D|nr:actin-associated protein FAM107A [Coregonus clupeaformis]
MGVTYGKKSEHHLQLSPTRSTTPLNGTASAHSGLLSEQDGEQGQGQCAEDKEHGKSGGSPPQPESQEEEGRDLIIQPKKRLNPVRVSKSHQELHRELRMTHKRGPCLEVKPELQRVLEQRNWEHGMKQRREAEEEKKNRSPLQQELFKRHQRLEELERELKAQQQQEGLQSSPEFIRVKESLRRTTILDVGEKVV